jgi:hypothetical protein
MIQDDSYDIGDIIGTIAGLVTPQEKIHQLHT